MANHPNTYNPLYRPACWLIGHDDNTIVEEQTFTVVECTRCARPKVNTE